MESSAALLIDYAKFLSASRGVSISASNVVERLTEELLSDKLFLSSEHNSTRRARAEVGS
jgi:hypothetical protein